MYTIKNIIFLATLCVVKSEESEMDHETMCKNDYRDKNNNTIDVLEYCSDKLCLEKCCGWDKIVSVDGYTCVEKKRFIGNRRRPDLNVQYRRINILSSSNSSNAAKKYVFVQNFRNNLYLPNCTAEHTEIDQYDILENGSLLWPVKDEHEQFEKLDKLKYCIDYKLQYIPGTKKKKISIVIRSNTLDSEDDEWIEKFENVGVLISSFFMILVLVVYCLLPDLRNLTGLVLMAYTLSLLFAFLLKSIVSFTVLLTVPPPGFCKILTPFMYFAFVSSFFWLSVYAFDVWWGLRSFRIKRNSKHGDLLKFMYYCLYAWGTPLLLTALVVTLDNNPEIVKLKSLFKDCLRKGDALTYYYKIPIGILIFVNTVMFCMTVYNIWMVKRAVNKCHDSRSNKQQSSKFATYAKLCLMMGVIWCLELLPDPEKDKKWLYLINVGNLFTGLTIFYLFVCKKIILLQLCKKLNIKNNYINNLEMQFARKRTRSGITRSTALSSTVRSSSKGKPQEMDLLQNCPKEENIP